MPDANDSCPSELPRHPRGRLQWLSDFDGDPDDNARVARRETEEKAEQAGCEPWAKNEIESAK